MKMASPEELLNQDRNGLHLLHESHYIAAKRYDLVGRCLGGFVVVLSAAAGTTVLQRLPPSSHAEVLVVTGIAAFAASALAAVQTFLAYPALAERHRTAAVRYGELRRDIDLLIAFGAPGSELESRLADIQARWNSVDKASPTVPATIINGSAKRIQRRRNEMAVKEAAKPAAKTG